MHDHLPLKMYQITFNMKDRHTKKVIPITVVFPAASEAHAAWAEPEISHAISMASENALTQADQLVQVAEVKKARVFAEAVNDRP